MDKDYENIIGLIQVYEENAKTLPLLNKSIETHLFYQTHFKPRLTLPYRCDESKVTISFQEEPFIHYDLAKHIFLFENIPCYYTKPACEICSNVSLQERVIHYYFHYRNRTMVHWSCTDSMKKIYLKNFVIQNLWLDQMHSWMAWFPEELLESIFQKIK
jgi:hypothetical protein